MSRAAVVGYTGKGSPPSCEMAFQAVSDTKKAPNLSLTVNFNGVKKQNRELKIERPGEGDVYPCLGFNVNQIDNSWHACDVKSHSNNYLF